MKTKSGIAPPVLILYWYSYVSYDFVLFLPNVLQAGLFSAIIAAFLIESYKLLQQNSTDLSAQLLMQISVQLAGLAGNSSMVVQVPEVPQFTAPSSAIRVNALWFAGLICSLATASLAIFVKQCLSEYLAWGCTSAEERIRVRHVRHEGLVRWRVFETAAVLPLLLQVAFLLFLVGLIEFLHDIDRTVWECTMILIVIWLSISAAAVFSPAFSVGCPYKTPLLNRAMQRFRWITSRLGVRSSWETYKSDEARDVHYHFPGDERGIRFDDSYDTPAIVSADETLADDGALMDTIGDCIKHAGGKEIVDITRKILSHRLGIQIHTLSDKIPFDRITTRVLQVAVDVLSVAIRRGVMSSNDQWKEWLKEAVKGLASLMNHVLSNGRAVRIEGGIVAIAQTFVLGLPEVRGVVDILATDSPFVESWSQYEIDGPPDKPYGMSPLPAFSLCILLISCSFRARPTDCECDCCSRRKAARK